MNALDCREGSDGLSRRTFLKFAGVAAAGLGWSGCASSPTGSLANLAAVRVKVSPSTDPLVARTFAILKERIEQRCAVNVVKVRKRAQIILTDDDDLPAEAFRIDDLGTAVRLQWLSEAIA
jgi:hypothetical protein